MFRAINTRACILVYTILFSGSFIGQPLAATKEGDELNAFVIGRASVQFKGCNNMNELISSGLTIVLQNSVLQNSLEGGDEPVEKEVAIETDQKGVFVSQLVYPMLSSIKEVRYKDLWRIPPSEKEGKVSYDVTEKGMCREQGMAVTFMEIMLTVSNDCGIRDSTNIFFGPTNEVAELLFHTILSMPEQNERTGKFKECLKDIIEARGGETQK